MSVPLHKRIFYPDRAKGYEIKQPFCPLAFPLFSVCVPIFLLLIDSACKVLLAGPCVAGLEMDVWPLGAAGREQHWSCQTGWGGCIRSSSPSSGVNRRSGTFTQPLTYVVTSEVMIKVRGQWGPLWSGSLQAPPACLTLPPRRSFSSFFFFVCFYFLFSLFSPSSPICLSIAHTLLHRPGPIETSRPLGVQKGKQEKINREDEWRPGGPIKNWMLLCVLVWFTHTDTHKHEHIQIDRQLYY